MVNYSDIYRSIVKRIKSKFDSITFSTDVEKAIIRPSFFIDLDNLKSSDFMNEALDRKITVRIYYFSTTIDDNQIELLNIRDNLNDLFLKDNVLEIDKFTKVEIQELEFHTIDKVLHCYFDIMLSENYDRVDDVEIMDDLDVDFK